MSRARLVLVEDATGRLLEERRVPLADAALQIAPEGATFRAAGEDVDLAREWFDGAALAPRPEHTDLSTKTVAVGEPLGGFPAGWPARLLLDGAVQAEGEIPASGALTFGDPGLWVVELLEAWALGPHRPRAYAISVTP